LADNPNQPEGSRRRIVIPLNQDQSAPRSHRVPGSRSARRDETSKPPRSRARKILTTLGLIIVAGVLIAIGGGFLWWQHYKTTPTYALAQLVDAAQRNDMATVDKIVDTDQIVSHLADEVTEKAASRYGTALSGDVRKTIAARVPTLLPQLRQQVHDALVARVKEIAARADQKPFVVIALAMPYFVKVASVGGELAELTATIQNRQIDLKMANQPEGWRLVSIHDDEMVTRLVDGVIKDLPAPGVVNDLKKKNLKPPAALRLP
jgi:Protein of unknown function (DUF2939)